MEDQKLLWIVFSVVLFAVVVLASVLYFLKPKSDEPALAAVGQTTGAGFDTYEYVRGTSAVPPMVEAPSRDLQIVVGQEPSPPAVTQEAPVSQSEPRPVDQPKPSTATPAASKPAAQKAAPTPARSAPAASTKPAPSAAPAQPTRLYWIQTASFKSRSGAEAMVESLGEKGVTGRVQVSDVGGQAYYRVRVGPYTSRDEADKFLTWIKGVDGLDQSYISVVDRTPDRTSD